MGCVHTRSKTFVTFSYQNSEEGLSTNNRSSTTLGFNNEMSVMDYNELTSHRTGSKRAQDHTAGYLKSSQVIVELKGHPAVHSRISGKGPNDALYKTSAAGNSSDNYMCSAHVAKKRKNFFYRSKSEDQKKFNEVVGVPEPGVVHTNSKFNEHHRSDNQLQSMPFAAVGTITKSRRQSFISIWGMKLQYVYSSHHLVLSIIQSSFYRLHSFHKVCYFIEPCKAGLYVLLFGKVPFQAHQGALNFAISTYKKWPVLNLK